IFSALSGMIDGIEIPARQSFVVEMVEKPEDLANAIALNSSLVNGARLLGPSIAGLLIAAVGEGWCFLINGVSFVAVLAALLSMRISHRVPPAPPKPFVHGLREGLHYALQSRSIATLLSMLALVSLAASSYSVLIPIFATEVLHGGAHTL